MHFAPCLLHPVKQHLHLPGHEMWRRSHKDAAVAVEDALMVTAELAGFLLGQIGHHAMQLLQVVEIVWVKAPQHPVSLIGVFDLLYFLLRPNDGFSADDAPHLVQRQGVCLNRQR